MERRVRGRLVPLLLGALVVAMGAVPLMFIFRDLASSRTPAPAVVREVPAFRLTGRDGRAVTLGDLAGSPWVADFIFTRCAGTCPRMTAEMRRLGERLPAGVRRVSFTVDPAYDTPEVLSRYAEAFGADVDGWWSLTGDESTLHSLAREGFLLGVEPGAGSDQEPIVHSTRFVLVDGRGRIRGYYDAFEEEGRARLLADLGAVLEEDE